MIYDSPINTTNSLISPDIYYHQVSSDQPLKLGIMASGNGSNFEVIAQAIADAKAGLVTDEMVAAFAGW